MADCWKSHALAQNFVVPLQEDYDRLRVISYMNCDVFLVCFAVDETESLKSVEANWVPELRRYLPKTPFILVGTRADRRDDGTTNKVRYIVSCMTIIPSNDASKHIKANQRNAIGMEFC